MERSVSSRRCDGPLPLPNGSGPSALSVLLQRREGEAPHRRVVVRDALDVLGLDQRGLVPLLRHGRSQQRDVVVDLGERLVALRARGQDRGVVDRLLIVLSFICGQFVLLAGRIASPLNVGLRRLRIDEVLEEANVRADGDLCLRHAAELRVQRVLVTSRKFSLKPSFSNWFAATSADFLPGSRSWRSSAASGAGVLAVRSPGRPALAASMYFFATAGSPAGLARKSYFESLRSGRRPRRSRDARGM